MSAEFRPTVVACVVSWNTAALTLRCLEALQAQRRPPDRIVVVDNASSDDSVTRLRARHPQATVLCTASNLGFAAAVGLAVQHAPEADAFWLVNSDAQAEPAALETLLLAWQQHGDALYGAAPLQRDAGGVDWLGMPAKFLSPRAQWSVWRRDAPIAYDAAWRARAPFQVAALVGSALLIPATLLHRHGGMNPEWFLYCEEIDYCLRLRRAGVACWLVPQARVQHRGGGSQAGREGVADVVAYYHTRNEIALARRHLGLGAAAVVALKKTLRGLASLAWRPQRGAFQLRGVLDAARGRRGKVLAPEAGLDAELQAALSPSVFTLLRRVRARLVRPAPICAIEAAGPSRVAFPDPPPPFLLGYQRFCVDLCLQSLQRESAALALAFGDCDSALNPSSKPLRIGLQWEHTLVRPGGRDSEGAPSGTVPLPDGSGHYLARLARRDELERRDLVLDYSRANLENLRRSGVYADYLSRCIPISPLLYEPTFDAPRRDLALISLMHDLRQTRRGRFVAAARRAGLPLRNVRGLYAPDLLRRLYRRSRILVNLHQTEHHHTLEELRVLPALLCGVVVVSEDVPLREQIPYADFIVWSRYDDLIDTLHEVDAHYENYRARLFEDPRLLAILQQMQADNEAAIAQALVRLR